MSDRMTLTIHEHRLFVQHARPSDRGLPYAKDAAVATSLLRTSAGRVQMDFDVEAGRMVKRALRSAGVIR